MYTLLAGPILVLLLFTLVPIYLWLIAINAVADIYISFIVLLAAALATASKTRISRIISLKFMSSIEAKTCALFIIYLFLVQIINFSLGDHFDRWGNSLFEFNIGVLVRQVAWLVCGYHVSSYLLSERSLNYITISWLSITIFFLSIVNYDSISIDFYSLGERGIGLHLILSDLYAIISILAIIIRKSLTSTIIVFAISILLLYLLGSRSTVAFFFAGFIAFISISSQFKWKFILLTLLIPLLLTLGAISETLVNSRMLILFGSELSRDQSYIERMIQMHRGLEHIASNPILGGYKLIVEDFGSFGSYMHNILSYWQVYGIVGFLGSLYLFLILPAFGVANSALSRKKLKPSILKKAVIFLSIYVILQLLLSRSYVWNYPWFLLGMYIYIKTNNGKNFDYKQSQ